MNRRTDAEELAAFEHRALSLPERNWARWASDEHSKLYIVFPEVSDTELEDVLLFTHRLYGSENVVIGDVFDEKKPWVDEDRRPSVGIYVTFEGLAYAEQRWLHGGVALATLRLGDRVDVLERVMQRYGPGR